MSKRSARDDYMDAVAERNRASRRLREAGAPRVGIFWFIQEPGQSPRLLSFDEPVQLGRSDGIHVKCTENHESWWNIIMGIIKQFPTSPSAFLQGTGPRDWPRGCVVFNTVEKRFEIHVDRQLQTPYFRAEILDYFHVPKAEASFASDSDYTDTRFTLGPPVSAGPIAGEF